MCLGLTLFHVIFSYVSFGIQFCFIFLTLFISNVSHIFLFDFNIQLQFSIPPLSCCLLKFIYSFTVLKEINITESAELFIF